MNSLLTFLLHRNTILAIMTIAAVITGLSDAFSQGTGEAWFEAAVIIFVFATLAWFTFTEQPVATWTTILVLILKGTDLMYDSILGLIGEFDSSFFTIAAQFVGGIYLTWGALVVHRERPVRR